MTSPSPFLNPVDTKPYNSGHYPLLHRGPEDPKELRNPRGPAMAVKGYLETGSRTGAPERGQMKPALPLTSNLAGEAEATPSAGGEWEKAFKTAPLRGAWQCLDSFREK